MNKRAAYCCAALVLCLPTFAMSTDVQSYREAPDQDGKVVGRMRVAESATVKAIDKEKRLVTLLMPNGKEQTLLVDQAVKRLGEVEVGDTVRAVYDEAISVKINKTKVTPRVTVEQTTLRDEESPTPAGETGVTLRSTATITRIYDGGKMATLRFPDGSGLDVQVRDPENLAKIRSGEVKEGDQVDITYRRALALSVEKR